MVTRTSLLIEDDGYGDYGDHELWKILQIWYRLHFVI